MTEDELESIEQIKKTFWNLLPDDFEIIIRKRKKNEKQVRGKRGHYNIKTGIKRGYAAKYPFRIMEVGEAFKIVGKVAKHRVEGAAYFAKPRKFLISRITDNKQLTPEEIESGEIFFWCHRIS